MSFSNTVTDLWRDPKKRKIMLISGSLLAAYFLAPVFFGSNGKKATPVTQTNATTSLFAIDKIDEMEEQKTKAMFDQYAAAAQTRDAAAAAREQRAKKQEQKVETDLAKMRNKIADQDRMLKQLQQALAKRDASLPNNKDDPATKDGNGTLIRHNPNTVQVVEKPQTQTITREPMIRGSMIRTVTQGKIRQVKETGKIEEKDVQLTSLSEGTQTVKDTTGGKNKAGAAAKATHPKPKDQGAWLSAGSILTGTLLNGVDAPTAGTQQSKMPMPVLIRLKQEALMANNYTMDLRECLIIGTALGDLATSRAYIRAETLSCNTEDGKAIEVPLTAYAVGRDGKSGLDGRLVSKSGGMMANAMAAGLLSGLGTAATPSQVSVLSTTASDTTAFQSANMRKIGEAGALEGASTSFDMLAKYYLELVDASWPVVEVLGGREVDFIVQKGTNLKIKG